MGRGDVNEKWREEVNGERKEVNGEREGGEWGKGRR